MFSYQRFFQLPFYTKRIEQHLHCFDPKDEKSQINLSILFHWLCNFIYKIISKTLVNRLKPLMHSVISQNQVAFIPNTAIRDNITIAHEAFHCLRTKKNTQNHNMAIKIHMHKAYDRIK